MTELNKLRADLKTNLRELRALQAVENPSEEIKKEISALNEKITNLVNEIDKLDGGFLHLM